MKTIGIAAHSAEGAGLCFLTACRVGGEVLGEHMHPPIVMSAIPMALSMPGWDANDLSQVEPHLIEGVRMLAGAGADFFVCPDNTAHLVLERGIGRLPLPGLHIAHVIVAEIRQRGFTRVGLLGTRWTMTGEVYARALAAASIERLGVKVTPQQVAAKVWKAVHGNRVHWRVGLDARMINFAVRLLGSATAPIYHRIMRR